MALVPRNRGLEVEQIGDVTVVRFAQRSILEEEKIQVMGRQLFDLVENFGCRKFIVNFGNVQSLSSTMVGKLFALHRKVQAAGGRLVLCTIIPELREIFEILKLPELCSVYEEEQEALQSF
jgi:anti-sigma B factor antagonist